MQDNKAHSGKLDEAVKAALSENEEAYNAEDWDSIQAALSSRTSSLNPLEKFNFSELLSKSSGENNAKIIIAILGLALVGGIIMFLSNLDSQSKPNDNFTDTTTNDGTPAIDSIGGLDTLKTIVITNPVKKDSVKNNIAANKDSIKHTEQKVFVKKDTLRRKKTDTAITKKKKANAPESLVEEIDLTTPKPSINIVKKKRIKEPTETKPAVQENKPAAEESPAPATEAKPQEQPQQTTEGTGGEAKKPKKKSRRQKPDSTTDQKPKSLEEVE